MTRSEIILHISLIDGIGPVALQKIIKTLDAHHAWDNIAQFKINDCIALLGISPACAQKLLHGLADQKLFDSEYEYIQKHAIFWTTIVDQEYPPLLATIYAPPSVIYWQGRSPKLYEQTIAIVGSRQAHAYATSVINALVPVITHHNINVISGGALGADSMAHWAAVHANSPTIVVLGSGLLQWAPKQHEKLFERVLENGGTILSNFPLNEMPLSGNFPARNRIIAGLSKACLIVQAAEKSGALITAKFALEQGRDVLAVPGRIDDPLSCGTNWLLSQGAQVYTKPQDVLELFGIYNAPETHKKMNNQTIDEQLSIHYSPAQKQIFALCKNPISVDDLMMQTDFTVIEIQNVLFELQVMKVVEQDFSGLWYIKKNYI